MKDTTKILLYIKGSLIGSHRIPTSGGWHQRVEEIIRSESRIFGVDPPDIRIELEPFAKEEVTP